MNSEKKSASGLFNSHLLLLMFMQLLSTACTSLPKPEMNPDQPSLKVITYNINWGGNQAQKIVDYLEKADADIVFLQETHKYWEDFILLKLGKKYPHAHFHNFRGAGGIAFISKYELTNIKTVKPSTGWFPGLIAEASTEIGKIQLLNVHLKPPLSDQGSFSISALYSSSDIHRGELFELLSHVDPAKPLIIGGDFNENDDDGGIESMYKKGFKNALLQYDDDSPTWKWRLPLGIPLSARYDHLIYNHCLHCSGAEVTQIPASDHMPVRAVFVKPGALAPAE